MRSMFVLSLGALSSLLPLASAQAALDTDAPVLTAFSVSGSIDAARSGQAVTVNLQATDNLSGVYYYIIALESPSGRQVVQEGLHAAASKTFSSQVVIGYPRYMNIELGEHFSRWSEPGMWRVVSVDVRDLAGNARVYDEAALAALGPHQFSVTNTKADSVKPMLHVGSLDTPVLSLSTPPRGTAAGTPPLALATVDVSDAGSPSASGVDVVSAYFCKLPFDGMQCADAFGLVGVTGTPIQKKGKMKIGDLLVSHRHPGMPLTAGVYHLMSLTLTDVAGNSTGLLDSAFGGSDNLSVWFPSGTTVTVNP